MIKETGMFAQGLGVNEEREGGRLTVIDMVNAYWH
jgi:hypothetical protein